jgi:phosphoenolpyruvate carboxykinase (ATP)
LDGTANDASFRQDENFGFDVPIAIKHVPNDVLNPRETWADMDAYDIQAKKLVKMFEENFKQYQ